MAAVERSGNNNRSFEPAGRRNASRLLTMLSCVTGESVVGAATFAWLLVQAAAVLKLMRDIAALQRTPTALSSYTATHSDSAPTTQLNSTDSTLCSTHIRQQQQQQQQHYCTCSRTNTRETQAASLGGAALTPTCSPMPSLSLRSTAQLRAVGLSLPLHRTEGTALSSPIHLYALTHHTRCSPRRVKYTKQS